MERPRTGNCEDDSAPDEEVYEIAREIAVEDSELLARLGL